MSASVTARRTAGRRGGWQGDLIEINCDEPGSTHSGTAAVYEAAARERAYTGANARAECRRRRRVGCIASGREIGDQLATPAAAIPGRENVAATATATTMANSYLMIAVRARTERNRATRAVRNLRLETCSRT